MHPRVSELIKLRYDAQKSEEWLRLRGKMLTASDVATALGDNPYESRQSLILKKCFKAKNGFNGNDATRHGEKYENEAREIYCSRTGEKAHDLGLVQHQTIDWLGGSADGITENGILLEIKCPMKRAIKDEVPKYYLPQIQILLEVLDMEVCDFIQYKPAEVFEIEEFVVTRVQRDREWFKTKYPILKNFWDEVIYRRSNGLCDII
jgi:hypothetical protein